MDIKFDYNSYLLAACLLLTAVSIFLVLKKGYPAFIRCLRLIFFGFFLILILNPVLNFKSRESRKPETAYVIDSSVYMRSHSSPISKLSKLKLSEKWLRESGVGTDKIFYAADKLYTSPPPVSGETYYPDFTGAISALPAGYERIVYFTDGYSRVSDAEERVEFVLVGEPSAKDRLRIDGLMYPDIAFLHIPFNIRFEIPETAGAVRMELWDNGSLVMKDGPRQAPFKTEFKAVPQGIGKHDYKLCAFSGGESKCLNFSVNVCRDKLRIIYLNGAPGHGYYFLREYLKSNPSIDLLSFIILREPADSINVREDELSLIPFPREEIFLKDIFHFDVLILEEFDFRQMAINSFYLDNVEKFVKDGGSLLLIGAGVMAESIMKYSNENFKSLLPAIPYSAERIENTHIFPSPHPVSSSLGEDIPPLTGEFAFSVPAAGARSILSFRWREDTYPLVAEKKHGKGRVVMINSMSLWQWKTVSGREKNRYFYYDFYKSVFSWLDSTLDLKRADFAVIKTDRFRINSYVLNANYKPLERDEAVFRGTISGKGVNIPLVFSFQRKGLYRSYLPPLEKGSYLLNIEVRFSDGHAEKYSGRINLDENILYRDGSSPDGLERQLNGKKILKLSELKPGWFASQEKIYYRVKRSFSPLSSVYFLIFLILFFSLELAFRRRSGEF